MMAKSICLGKRIVVVGLLIFVALACNRKAAPVGQGTVVVESQTPLDYSKLEPENNDPIVSPSYKGRKTQYWDLTNVELKLEPNWTNRTLPGLAILSLIPHAYATDSLTLNARGMTINTVNQVDESGLLIRKLSYNYNDSTLLKIKFPEKVSPFKKVYIAIDYEAKPELQFKKKLINDATHQGLYFINPDNEDNGLPQQLWTQGEPEDNCGWFPNIEDTKQKYTQTIYLTVDSNLRTMSNGDLVYSELNADGTRTDLWEQKKPHSSYLTVIAAGEFDVLEDKYKNMPLRYYLEPKYSVYGKRIFQSTPKVLEFFSNKFGVEYPWGKLDQMVVRNFVSGAMENTGAIVHGEFVQQDEYGQFDVNSEDYIVHEVCHQWFGDLVTCEDWANLTLNEGFATFGEQLWYEHKYGQAAAEQRRIEDFTSYNYEVQYTGAQPLIQYNYNKPQHLFDAHRYKKGGLVWHLLRYELGDEVFFNAIKTYLNRYGYKSANVDDLRNIMEEVSGKDLHPWFKQWTKTPGHPNIYLSPKYDSIIKSTVITATQLQSPAFFIDLPIRMYTQEFNYIDTVWHINHRVEPFIVPSNILYVFADPHQNLPCLIQLDSMYVPANEVFALNSVRNFTPRERLFAAQHINMRMPLIASTFKLALFDSFASVRRTMLIALDTTSDSTLVNSLLPELVKVVKTDKVSTLRTTALGIMVKHNILPQNFLMTTLNDSSYYVKLYTLRMIQKKIYKTDTLAYMLLLRNYEYAMNNQLLMEIASTYSKVPLTTHTSFWNAGFRQISSNYVSGFYEYYNTWLKKISIETLLQQGDLIIKMHSKCINIEDNESFRKIATTALNKLNGNESPLAKQFVDQLQLKLAKTPTY